jgi:hypothetical protein
MISYPLRLCRRPLAPDPLTKLEEAAARVLSRSLSVATPRVADAAAGLLHLVQPHAAQPSADSPSDATTETDIEDGLAFEGSDGDLMVRIYYYYSYDDDDDRLHRHVLAACCG